MLKIMLNLKSSLYIWGNSPLSNVFFANIFSQVSDLSSHSFDIVFDIAKIFYFNEVQLNNYLFHWPCFWCHI